MTSRSTVLCLALATMMAFSPSLTGKSTSDLYPAAFAKEGKGKAGDGKGGKAGRSSDAGTQKAAGQPNKRVDSSLADVLQARKEVEEATERFNRALADPSSDLEPFVAAIEKAEKRLLKAGAKYQAQLAQDSE